MGKSKQGTNWYLWWKRSGLKRQNFSTISSILRELVNQNVQNGRLLIIWKNYILGCSCYLQNSKWPNCMLWSSMPWTWTINSPCTTKLIFKLTPQTVFSTPNVQLTSPICCCHCTQTMSFSFWPFGGQIDSPKYTLIPEKDPSDSVWHWAGIPWPGTAQRRKIGDGLRPAVQLLTVWCATSCLKVRLDAFGAAAGFRSTVSVRTLSLPSVGSFQLDTYKRSDYWRPHHQKLVFPRPPGWWDTGPSLLWHPFNVVATGRWPLLQYDERSLTKTFLVVVSWDIFH